ncbi:MAG: Na(+)-translocating NADH-quinone reductase subunit C [Gemmatimonadota bacterium]|nr:MAG: Na(+)-translocating NADH-quinone reductase subunit C [Gemmatimonadota bacterium]
MSDFRVIRFAIIVCLACSVVLSAAAIGLRDRQDANLIFDQRRNILKSVGLFEDGMGEAEVNAIYGERMVGLVLRPDGTVLEGRVPSDIDEAKESELLALYQRLDDGKVGAYSFPVSGKGLWSTLYGYFALEADLNTVAGITFYQHGETPGLGGEIDKPWFQHNFVGKKILDEAGDVVSVTVVKGTAADQHSDPKDLSHYVDGISGATITSRGVTKLVKMGLERYEPYFGTLRSGAGRTT